MTESAPVASMTPEDAAALLVQPPSPFALSKARIDGVEHTVFTFVPKNLATLYALAKRHDERVMIVYEDERYTFAEVARRVANLAHHLVHDFGVGKGDRIALAMRNYPEWCFTYVAATSIGAIIVPLNAWWTGPELRYGIVDSGAKLLVADDERYLRVASDIAELGIPALVARPTDNVAAPNVDMRTLLDGDFALPQVDVAPDDDATIMYTSGSTGHPKGVVSTHRAIVSAVCTWEFLLWARVLVEVGPAVIDRVKAWLALGPAAFSSAPFEMPQSSMLITLPLFHVTGSNVQFLPAFRNGRKLVLMHKWNPERALELIEREKITDFSGVPTMSWELVNSPEFAKRDTSTLRSLSAGGASRPPEHVKQLSEKAQNAPPSTGYGMTETNSLGAAIGGPDYQQRPASVGRPLKPLVEINVVDEQGRVLGPNQEGEIRIKSVTNMRGYWNRLEETAQTLRDGYIYSGDLGSFDDEGFLTITGRAKEIVIRGGENISCAEVEYALYEHPAVFEVAVYGVPDERLGEAVAATVMLKPGAQVTVSELLAHTGTRIARFKIPSHIWLQDEQLPRIASAKIDKRTLKREAIDRLAKESDRVG